jgi:hypothetical protein
MPNPISHDNIDQALSLLAGRLDLAQTDPVRLVICGGSALIAMSLRQRTTRDVDVVALLSLAQEPISPDPLPDFLLRAADQVARDLGLFEGWLNNGPSRGEGGLFQMGLPEGFVGRLTEKKYGPRLAVYFIGRLDQIHFKLYAAADQRDGTHLNDLNVSALSSIVAIGHQAIHFVSSTPSYHAVRRVFPSTVGSQPRRSAPFRSRSRLRLTRSLRSFPFLALGPGVSVRGCAHRPLAQRGLSCPRLQSLLRPDAPV